MKWIIIIEVLIFFSPKKNFNCPKIFISCPKKKVVLKVLPTIDVTLKMVPKANFCRMFSWVKSAPVKNCNEESGHHHLSAVSKPCLRFHMWTFDKVMTIQINIEKQVLTSVRDSNNWDFNFNTMSQVSLDTKVYSNN